MSNEHLPDDLPGNPLPLLDEWLQYARSHSQQPNPDAMTLATVTAEGHPNARIVLCKQFNLNNGYVTFFTNYQSTKGQELQAHPYAAVVMHWDHLHRQVRLQGQIVKSPAAESDAYFNIRAVISQVGAWASHQSRPLSSRAQLAAQVEAVNQQYSNRLIPRPAHWGGFRLWISSLELWLEGPGRVHDRARWTRAIIPTDEFNFAGDAWQATRLNP
ncbi:MAG TPA: pyridoxamine 5'-phosphate oxidase [Steroidobacteraceae bacterium]|nr:pyridoxamine 5'-phosphate oxidase [Steroidobacteraceae bacterium]